MAGHVQMGQGLRVKMKLLQITVMQRPQISTASHIFHAGSLRSRGLHGVPPQQERAPSCGPCHTTGRPWACAEVQWHAGALDGPVWRFGQCMPNTPHAAKLVPSPNQAFSVRMVGMSMLTVEWQHRPP